jgi:hypothetical protein
VSFPLSRLSLRKPKRRTGGPFRKSSLIASGTVWPPLPLRRPCARPFSSFLTNLMKTLLPALAFCVAAASAQAQLNQTNTPASTTDTNSYVAVERGPHYCVWQRIEYATNLSGQIVAHTHRYTELSTGLNHWDAGANDWKESSEQIRPVFSQASPRDWRKSSRSASSLKIGSQRSTGFIT